MKTKEILPVFLLLLFLGGCSYYEVGGEGTFSLDHALAMARARCSGNIYPCHLYWCDLEELWRQAPPDDKEILEREMLTFLLKQAEINGEADSYNLIRLAQRTSSEEIKKAAGDAVLKYEQTQETEAEPKRQEERAQVRERTTTDQVKKAVDNGVPKGEPTSPAEAKQKRAEEIRLAFRESRERLLRTGAGRLDDKSAEQVKKLVVDWIRVRVAVEHTQYSQYWFLEDFLSNLNDDELGEYFGTDVFYRVFGQPKRKQFISSEGAYYFYYECRDGTVQIEVPAALLEKNVVVVSDLNIF